MNQREHSPLAGWRRRFNLEGHIDEGMMPPGQLRAKARTAFIRALAVHTPAIRQLRSWQLSAAARAAERGRASEATRRLLPNPAHALEQSAAEHLFEPVGLSHSLFFTGMHALLYEVAEPERVHEADAWCARWRLEAPWLRAWAVFALLRWEIGRECGATNCAHGCAATRADNDLAALDLVTTPWAMLYVIEDQVTANTEAIVAALNAGDSLELSLPLWCQNVGGIVPPPHPLWESKDEFLQRVRQAWEIAVQVLAARGAPRDRLGRDLSAKRRLETHAGWLARYQVNEETARAIFGNRDKGEESTVSKRVRQLADLIGLPLRGRMRRTTRVAAPSDRT